ncbi:MAG: hypothetical protein JWQ49_6643 [Edaphobacter sp.]|nr:hypothetical protein [Edaphobacter sp.]
MIESIDSSRPFNPSLSSSINNVIKITSFLSFARRSAICAILLLITIPIGLAVRLLPLGLPWFLYKYLGSTLWAVALYWFLGTLLPKLRPRAVATIAILVATLLELSRLIPIAPIDAFRLTFAGKILLGRYFSLKNIAAYIFAIALAATADHLLLKRDQQNPDNLAN